MKKFIKNNNQAANKAVYLVYYNGDFYMVLNISALYEKKYYVYQHSINGEIFYIGKGTGNRALDFYYRSDEWKDFVKGRFSELKVEILMNSDSEEEVLKYEKAAILFSDRNLINKTYNKPIIRRKKFKIDTEKLIEFLNSLVGQRLYLKDKKFLQNILYKDFKLRPANGGKQIGMKTINSFFEENNIPYKIESKKESKGEQRGKMYWILKEI